MCFLRGRYATCGPQHCSEPLFTKTSGPKSFSNHLHCSSLRDPHVVSNFFSAFAVPLEVTAKVLASKWKIKKKMTTTQKENLVRLRIKRDFRWPFLLRPAAPNISVAAQEKARVWAKAKKKITKKAWQTTCLYIDVKKWSPRYKAAAKRHQNLQKKKREYRPKGTPLSKVKRRVSKENSHTDGGSKALSVLGAYGDGKLQGAWKVSETITKKRKREMQAEGVDDDAQLRGNWSGKYYRDLLGTPTKHGPLTKKIKAMEKKHTPAKVPAGLTSRAVSSPVRRLRAVF